MKLTGTDTAKGYKKDFIFRIVALSSIALSLIVLATLLCDIFIDGFSRISWQFITTFPSRTAEKAGILSALMGSLYLMLLVIVIAFPVGAGAALYLEEFAPKNRLTRLIELNIANLAGVPSIIYGILGLQIFVRVLGMGRTLIAGALTMSLLILPIIIIASREALRQIPHSIREGSLALGATKLQTVSRQILPLALPGMMTGCILAFSRAIGETAPLVTLGALTYVAFVPDGLFSPFTVLPIQSFNWISRPQEAFHKNAAAAIVVLLIILLFMNAFAIWFRNKFQRRLS